MKKGQLSRAGNDGRFNGVFHLTPSLKAKPKPIWKIWKHAPDLPVEVLVNREREYKYCCQPLRTGYRCGAIATYRVGRSGFCMGHRNEAYAAQNVYWNRKLKVVIGKALKYA